MQITAEAIEKRIAELESERAMVIGRAQAITGALQDCEFWRKQLESGDEVETLAPVLDPQKEGIENGNTANREPA